MQRRVFRATLPESRQDRAVQTLEAAEPGPVAAVDRVQLARVISSKSLCRKHHPANLHPVQVRPVIGWGNYDGSIQNQVGTCRSELVGLGNAEPGISGPLQIARYLTTFQMQRILFQETPLHQLIFPAFLLLQTSFRMFVRLTEVWLQEMQP